MEPSILSSSNKRKEHENLQRSLGVCLKLKRYIQWYCKQWRWWWVLFCLFVLICSSLHCTAPSYLELPKRLITWFWNFFGATVALTFGFQCGWQKSLFNPIFCCLTGQSLVTFTNYWSTLFSFLSSHKMRLHYIALNFNQCSHSCLFFFKEGYESLISCYSFFTWFMIDQWIKGLPLSAVWH